MVVGPSRWPQESRGAPSDAPACTAILEACRARGVLIGKGGLYGNVLRLAPPLTVTEDEIDAFADAFASAVAEVYDSIATTPQEG